MAPVVFYGIIFVCIAFVHSIINKIFSKWRNWFKLEVMSSTYIFVTSCDDTLGRKLVQALEDLGFCVFAGCATRIGAEKIKQNCSDKVVPVVFDIKRGESIDDVCVFITRYLPVNTGLWAIIHNLNIISAPSLFEWTRSHTVCDVINTSLVGTLRICKRLLPWLRRSHGRIVMTTSDNPATFPTWLEHEVAFAGVGAFCTCLRRELCKTGVTTHTVGIPMMHKYEKSRELIKNRILQSYEDLIPEVQGYYGDRYVDFLTQQSLEAFQPSHNDILDLYTAAVTQIYPHDHYSVGGSRLPQFVSEYLCRKKVPVPEGIKWCKGLFGETEE